MFENSPTNAHQGLENSELHSFSTRYGPVAGACDHRNKPFGFHKIYKNLFTCWATIASLGFYSVKTIQQIHLYHKRSVTLPRMWCGGNPWRTDHRRKQTLCKGCEVHVLLNACILPSPHSQSWPNSHLEYSSDVQPPTKASLCMFNMSNTSALLINCTSCHKHIKLMVNVMSLSPNVYSQNC